MPLCRASRPEKNREHPCFETQSLIAENSAAALCFLQTQGDDLERVHVERDSAIPDIDFFLRFFQHVAAPDLSGRKRGLQRRAAQAVHALVGLELGADDYCTKPFSVRELLARVKANIRRTSSDAPMGDSGELITYQNLTISPSRYEVSKDDTVIDLTLREFELLKFLALQPGQIFTRETLLEKVWGYEYFGDVRTVDVTVRRLRKKVEDNPASPNFIMTKRGVGYYFNK